MMKKTLTLKKMAVLMACVGGLQLTGCASGPSMGDFMSSKASQLENYSDDWKKGAEMIEDGEDLLKDGEKNLAKGQDNVKEGGEMVREGSALIEESRQAYLQLSAKSGASQNATSIKAEAAKYSLIAKNWSKAEEEVKKGNKLIDKGNERVNKGQQQIKEGNKLIVDGRAMKLQSEKQFQASQSTGK